MKITCNNICYAQITMGVADYSKRQLKGSPFQEHRSKPHPSDYMLTCCNVQVKQRYCTMLATATGNSDGTNVTYNANKYYVVSSPGCTCLYLRQRCHFWCFNIRSDVLREISDVWCFGNKSDVDWSVVFFPNFLYFSVENKFDSWFLSFFHQFLTLNVCLVIVPTKALFTALGITLHVTHK